MKYNPEIHHRRSIRLKGYDYSQQGAYFITICTHNRECLFGKIVNGAMVLNDAGKMVEKWWYELNTKFPNIEPDAHITMPNHFHGIIIIVGADLRVCPNNADYVSALIMQTRASALIMQTCVSALIKITFCMN